MFCHNVLLSNSSGLCMFHGCISHGPVNIVVTFDNLECSRSIVPSLLSSGQFDRFHQQFPKFSCRNLKHFQDISIKPDTINNLRGSFHGCFGCGQYLRE